MRKIEPRLNFKENKSLKISLLLAVVFLTLLLISMQTHTYFTLSLEQATELYKEGLITSIEIDKTYYILHTATEAFQIHIEVLNAPWVQSYPITQKATYGFYIVLTLLVPTVLFFTALFFHFPKEEKEMLQTATKVPKEEAIKAINSSVRFSDIAGITDVKEELEEIIDFLRHPKKYKQLDIRLPKGVLLEGPPGVGKTFISKAVAGEADVPFFYQSGASFAYVYVGMGPKRVSALFQKAKQMAPSIIFIDEIDAVGKSRGNLRNDEREATLNQLLTEMDGFEESSGVIVIGATNKIDILDEALLRAGRFDRRIHISLPEMEERHKILQLTLRKKSHNVNTSELAKLTVGFSSAALTTLTNEAAIYALKQGRDSLITEDFLAVKEKVLLGKKRGLTFSEEERKVQAIYQGAKAVLASWLDIEYEKIGIITTKLVDQEHEILTKTKLLNLVKFYLAGSIASKLHFNEAFNNASNDIAEAKRIIHQMVNAYAMGENFLESPNLELEFLKESSMETTALLKTLQRAIEQVSHYLLENENITHDVTQGILRELF
jgi:ATP-dependent metalloprotease FtsH